NRFTEFRLVNVFIWYPVVKRTRIKLWLRRFAALDHQCMLRTHGSITNDASLRRYVNAPRFHAFRGNGHCMLRQVEFSDVFKILLLVITALCLLFLSL